MTLTIYKGGWIIGASELAHPDREAAKKNWASFQADPEKARVWAETEKDGPINLKVVSMYLNPVEFSPIK